MIVLRRNFSDKERRISRMKGKLLLDDIGTSTGIHPLYRNLKEKVTGTKTLYHYTSSNNINSIMKNGFDPEHDKYSPAFKNSTGRVVESGTYFGNQSKSIPRSTAIARYRTNERRIREGKEPKEGWSDPGTMFTVKIPLKDYNKMKKRNSDPMSDYNSHKFFYENNKGYKREYDSRGKFGKLLMKGKVRLDGLHLKKDVILMQEKVDPKYITKIDNNWS